MGISAAVYTAVTGGPGGDDKASAPYWLAPEAGFYVANSKAHAKTDAQTKTAEAQQVAAGAIREAETQRTNTLDKQAGNTAALQAKVRAIANPDGDSLITSPLGGNPTQPGSVSGQQPPVGTLMTPGKSTVGG